MKSIHHSSPYYMEDHEFYLILGGSFIFYLLLIFAFYFFPFDLNHPVLKQPLKAGKITMILPPKTVPKPLPPPPLPEHLTRKPPVPIVPKNAKKPAPPPIQEKVKPIPEKEIPPPPKESPEEIERKKEEALALQRAKEQERNREVARNKFASLFGNSTDAALQNKELNVISTPQSISNSVTKATPKISPSDDLHISIKTQDAEQILKELPSGKEKKTTATLGEHQTKSFDSGGKTEKLGSIRSPEEFEKSFKAYEGRLKAFYDKTIQAKPSLKGVMIVKITIAADGTVVRCEIHSSGLNDKTFENEIARMIQEQFRFSKIAQGEEFYEKPLSFKPQK